MRPDPTGPSSRDALGDLAEQMPWLAEAIDGFEEEGTQAEDTTAEEEIYTMLPWLRPPPVVEEPDYVPGPAALEVLGDLAYELPWVAEAIDWPDNERKRIALEERADEEQLYAMLPWLRPSPDVEAPDYVPGPAALEVLGDLAYELPWLAEAIDGPDNEQMQIALEDRADEEAFYAIRPWLKPDAGGTADCGCTPGADYGGGCGGGPTAEPDGFIPELLAMKPWLRDAFTPAMVEDAEAEPLDDLLRMKPWLAGAVGLNSGVRKRRASAIQDYQPTPVRPHPWTLDQPVVPLPPASLRGPLVDIYLSAGPNEGYGPNNLAAGRSWDPSNYFSCNRDDARNCAIWRVRLRLGGSGPEIVEQLVPPSVLRGFGATRDQAGISMPALSPNGSFLAFRFQDWSDSYRLINVGFYSAINIFNLATGAIITAAETIWDADKPLRFPVWYDDRKLLFNQGNGGGSSTLWEADFHPSSFSVSGTRPIIGPGSGAYEGILFDDADVRRIGFLHPRLVTFGTSTDGSPAVCGSSSDGVPRVHDLATASNPNAVNFECFQLGRTATENDIILSCQHPAWSLDGKSVMCWQKSPGDFWGPEDADLKMLYTYRWSAERSRWEHPRGGPSLTLAERRMTFVPLLPRRLNATFGSLFPAFVRRSDHSYAPQCSATSYKHGSECGTDNFIVLTLFCADAVYNDFGDHSDVFSSRIMVIRREPLAYWDITEMIETYIGALPGDYHGIYATCGLADE